MNKSPGDIFVVNEHELDIKGILLKVNDSALHLEEEVIESGSYF